MAKKGPRQIVKLMSSAGTGHCYYTEKNTRETPDKMVLKKYDPSPSVQKHVEYKEGKMK